MQRISNRLRSSSNRPTIKSNEHLTQHLFEFSEEPKTSSKHSHSVSETLHNNHTSLNVKEIVTIFANHYKAVQQFFKAIQMQMTKLQTQISSLWGNFSQIQYKLNKGTHKLKEQKLMNQELLKINQEIEEKLEQVKQEYEEMKKHKYISNIEKQIEELKEHTHRLEIGQYKSKFNQHETILFEDNIEKLEMLIRKNGSKTDKSLESKVYQDIIRGLISILKDKKTDVGSWMEQKLMQNIKLKFSIIKSKTSLDFYRQDESEDHFAPQRAYHSRIEFMSLRKKPFSSPSSMEQF